MFSKGVYDLGRTSLVQHDIVLENSTPVKQAPRRMTKEKQEAADAQIEENCKLGLAQKSNSPWASPLVMVRKKDGSLRMCIDYRSLNDRTVKDAYPLPRIQDTLDTLSDSRWYLTLDLASGYWQVELTPEARAKSAFCSCKGLFEWTVMPFGLCNAPATFDRLMDRVLTGLQWGICLVYLDDVIVLGSTVEQMIDRLGQVFAQLRAAGLKLKPSKCFLFKRKVSYLGHVVSARGVATNPAKVQSIQSWPVPKNVHEVRQFVGLASYYRRYVQGFASIARPLHDLTKKGVQFCWTDECQQAFDELKCHLVNAPILGYPLGNGQMILDTDASNNGIGAVLSQMQGGEERVLAYASKTLSGPQRNYCTTRKELLAVVNYTSHFHQYLLGRPFIVRMDHSSLRWLVNFKQPKGQLARWLEKLSEFNFKVEHRPGKQHGNADALSWRPCPTSCPCQLQGTTGEASCIHQCSPPESLVLVSKELSADNSSSDTEYLSMETTSEDEGSDDVCISIVTPFTGWTSEELRQAQGTDPDIGPIVRWLGENDTKPARCFIGHWSPASKSYCVQWDRLLLKDGILVRKFLSSDARETWKQVILPRVFRDRVLEQLHDTPSGGHFGVDRTLSRVQTRFYWHGMRDDITYWCQTCTRYAAKSRSQKAPRAGLGTVRVGGPMERIAADIMGPLQETDRGNQYILVVQDYFTKWVEAYPLVNQQAETVAEAIVSEWATRFGAPYELHSDQGSNFESAVFQEMCKLLGVDKTRTTPMHPQSDGQVERFNATLQKLLSITSDWCHWDWDLMIPTALMAYRATKHTSTGTSPNQMLFGREITEPIDLVVGLPPGESMPTDAPSYVVELRRRLEKGHEVAREALGKVRGACKEGL